MKPVAITMGDAAGIGPEIIAKAFAGPMPDDCPALVVGSAVCMQEAVRRWAPALRLSVLPRAASFRPRPGVLQLVEGGSLEQPPVPGRVSAACGGAAAEAIRRAVQLALAQEVAAICTAPIHKEALAAAGVPYPGHTEMLAALSGTSDYAMMLMNPRLRTMLVTVHCALSEAIASLTIERELRIIRLAHRTLLGFGLERPRIAVAGLNPHAGEGGLFGPEDGAFIAPAVRLAREEGIDATGPHPGDTVFMHAQRGRYDLVVAQYHDQGLIPVKLMGVEDGVNFTAGLPFVRTSPDHGTAFDIAGRGLADASSLRAALAAARRLARPAPAHLTA